MNPDDQAREAQVQAENDAIDASLRANGFPIQTFFFASPGSSYHGWHSGVF